MPKRNKKLPDSLLSRVDPLLFAVAKKANITLKQITYRGEKIQVVGTEIIILPRSKEISLYSALETLASLSLKQHPFLRDDKEAFELILSKLIDFAAMELS